MGKKTRCLIIDDEELAIKVIESYVAKVDSLELVASCQNAFDAFNILNKEEVDLIFLDIEMPEQNGFMLFDYFNSPSFNVIFTTAYSEYAIKAFRLSAVDYLLKPIDLEELREAIKKVSDTKELELAKKKIKILKGNLNTINKKLALFYNKEYIFVELKDIIYCKAENNYTYFYLVSGEKLLIPRTLKTYDDLLTDFNFFRINRAHLINLNYVVKYTRQKQIVLTMSNGNILRVSDFKRREFLNIMEG